jgi:glycosyltransferase involved in cell wall biosynthesis
MKTLLTHNFYGSSAPSGENSVFDAEFALIKSHDLSVIKYMRHSDEIRTQGIWGKIKGAVSTPWNPFSYNEIKKIVKKESPDIVHVHNTFPLISPSIFHALKDSDSAVVMTLHNYRIFCAAGIPMRNNKICTECLDNKSSLNALKYGCYRKSRLATIPMALMIELHRKIGTWENHIDAFIALTEFQKHTMIQAGLPLEKVYIKPHFYAGNPKFIEYENREKCVVFVGRLGLEKGIFDLLNAWKLWGETAPLLKIIGDGELKHDIKRFIDLNGLDKTIKLEGLLPFEKVQKTISKSSLLILPSICFEGFPMTIREAFAHGVPVAGSDIGSIPDIVDEGINGVLFKPGNAKDLLEKVKALWNDHNRLELLAKAAKEKFEKLYTEDVNYEILMDIYQKAIENRKGK